MYVDADDFRPSSLYFGRAISVMAIAAGAVGAVLAGLMVSAVIFADLTSVADAAMGRGIQEELAEEAEEEPEEPEIIEAGFVQLGEEFDPRQLPDRMIQATTYAQRRPPRDAVSMQNRPTTDAGPQPLDALEADLQRISTSIEERLSAHAPQVEGSIDGVAGRAREGDLYAGRILSIFRRGLNAPPNVPDSELRSLRAGVRFVIGEDRRFRSITTASRSGNADYDRAVQIRINQILSSGITLPPPPEGSDWIGTPKTIAVLPPRTTRSRGGAGGHRVSDSDTGMTPSRHSGLLDRISSLTDEPGGGMASAMSPAPAAMTEPAAMTPAPTPMTPPPAPAAMASTPAPAAMAPAPAPE